MALLVLRSVIQFIPTFQPCILLLDHSSLAFQSYIEHIFSVLTFLLRTSTSDEIRDLLLFIGYDCTQAKGILPTLFYASDFARFLPSFLPLSVQSKTEEFSMLSRSLSSHQNGLSDRSPTEAIHTVSSFLQGMSDISEESFGLAMEVLFGVLKPEQFWKIETLIPLLQVISKTNRYAELATVLFRPRGNAQLLAENLLICLHSIMYFQLPPFEVRSFSMSLILDGCWRRLFASVAFYTTNHLSLPSPSLE